MSKQSSKSGPYVSYLVRRETHSSRALISVIVALLLMAGLGYLATEGVLAALGRPPLLATPQDLWEQPPAALQEKYRPLVIIVGIVLGLFGLGLLAKAILPGTLSKHALKDDRAAYVADDSVIASGISRLMREDAGLPQGTVSTAVSKRRSLSTITPTTGRPIDQEQMLKLAKDEAASWQLQPRLKTAIKVSQEGRLEK
ncbi:hypothetical protein [Varibaculum cambriense]|uniref:hypothetical protein n=1 Tax=Varibaculum cambriense TaxID=184870 RepID=UPI00241DB9D0|nr:hypothetical protein [Varibaculum cambriense]MBS5943938.1 hypothetical protein [Varibaculum cambriense]